MRPCNQMQNIDPLHLLTRSKTLHIMKESGGINLHSVQRFVSSCRPDVMHELILRSIKPF